MSTSLQDRLLGFEAPPPQRAWEAIAAALDAEGETYPDRLAAYAEEPPANLWAVIETALEGKKQTTKVVPFFTAYKKTFRYLAAASLLAALLVSAFLLTRNKVAEIAGTNGSLLGKTVTGKMPSPKPDNGVAVTTETYKHSPEDAPKPSVAKRLLSFIRPQKMGQSLALTDGFIPKTPQVQAMFDASLADDLMVYSDGDGNAMKVPKKLFDLVCCRDGDGTCRERVQRLQQKLSASNVSGDFFGMLDQIKELE